MKRKEIAQLIGILVAVGLIILAVYFSLHQKEDESLFESSGESSLVEQVLRKDLERNYPATVKAVVEMYSQITECMYNEPYSEEEFDLLAKQMRNLYDEELLAVNPEEAHLRNLKQEYTYYREQKYSLTWKVQKLSSVKEEEVDGTTLATIVARYTINMRDINYYEFCLREDADGNWKIIGWKQVAEVDMGD